MNPKLCPKCGRHMYIHLTQFGKEYTCICGNYIKNPSRVLMAGENEEMRLKCE
jgi:ssDNA-binding Zn-finger/Zn-ribbon topoisomerase 1